MTSNYNMWETFTLHFIVLYLVDLYLSTLIHFGLFPYIL